MASTRPTEGCDSERRVAKHVYIGRAAASRAEGFDTLHVVGESRPVMRRCAEAIFRGDISSAADEHTQGLHGGVTSWAGNQQQAALKSTLTECRHVSFLVSVRLSLDAVACRHS